MDRYIFILGRNWRLALAEIDSYLQTETYSGKIIDYSANVAVVEFEKPQVSLEFIADFMIRLGSVQKIAKMYDFIDIETFENAFPRDADIEENRALVFSGRKYVKNTLKDIVYELFPKIKDQKIFIANSIYPESFDNPYYSEVLVSYFLHYVNKFFNTFLKEKGAKQAIYYRYPQENIESGNLNPIFPHHFITYRLYEENRVEIIYSVTEQGVYIGKTLTVVDSNFQKGMDEERPYKEFQQTIPPKFAKTLISFLGLPPPLHEKKIYDPFCGAGTILQFGYMLKFQVYGSDLEKKQVIGTRNNIKFTSKLLQKQISKTRLSNRFIESDIKEIDDYFPENHFDGIVSEPVLLPYYKHAPDYEETHKLLKEKIIPLYKIFIEKSYKLLKPGSKLAFVSPIINTKQKRKIGLPIDSITKKAGFKAIQLLNPTRFFEKFNPRFQIKRKDVKSIFDAGSKHFSREFFLFIKPKKRIKRKK